MALAHNYPELFNALTHVVPSSVKVYLVGGAVRDELLGYAINDFDFVSEGLVRPIGKKLANEMNGKYYVLDEDREMVRVIINFGQDYSYNIDIAQISGSDIEGDLSERDFTINAIALEFLNKERIIDPLGGVMDLRKKKLRMCSPNSLQDDPLRAVRAIRLALEFDLQMDEELIHAMDEITPELHKSSYERYRDELCKALRTTRSNTALELYQRFGFLDFLFPGFSMDGIKDIVVFLGKLEELLHVLSKSFDEEKASNLYSGYAVLRAGEYRKELQSFFDQNLVLYHTRRILLSLCGMIMPVCSDHGQKMVDGWMKKLAFSHEEIDYVDRTFNAFHYLKSKTDFNDWNNIGTYHYFKKFRDSGISGGVLFLATVLIEPESQNKYDKWKAAVELFHALCDAWFNHQDDLIKPVSFLSGDEICALLSIPPGKLVGNIKEQLLDKQVSKEITDITGAEQFCLSIVDKTTPGNEKI